MAMLTALAVASPHAVAAAPGAGTAYPGGVWQPGPARYGVQIVDHVKLPMDDGVVLDASIAYPTDLADGQRAKGLFPVVIEDTPYITQDIPPNSTGTVNPYYARYGYISVRVHSRGTGASGGKHGFWSPREAQDGAVMVDWAAHRLAGSDGRVAIVGCSFPGGHALGDAAAVGRNSPLKAVVAACIALDSVGRHDIMVSGVATQDIGFLYEVGKDLTGNNPETIGFYKTFADDIRRGGDSAYARDFWNQRLPRGAARKIVDNEVPVLLWTGWRDPVGIGAVRTYAAFQNAARNRPIDAPMLAGQPTTPRYQIIVGDWKHAVGLDNGIILQWIETWLKGVDTGLQKTRTPMHMIESRTNRWINAARYPLVDTYTPWHLRASGALNATAAIGRSSDTIAWGNPAQPGHHLDYTTPPFAGGTTLAGPISASVYASSSNSNLQLIAQLFDVAPDGTAVKVTQGAMIGSLRTLDPKRTWRDSRGVATWPWQTLARDAFLMPDKVYRMDIHLEPRQWGVLPGHRLRIAFTTSVPATLCPGAEKSASGNDPCYLTALQAATVPGGRYRIWYGPGYPSQLNLPQAPTASFVDAGCNITPTSAGICLPHDWGN